MRYSLTNFGGEALGNHFAASHPKFKVLLQKSCGVITLLLLLAAAASAQSDTAGSTPLGLTPGAPAGSYSLSGFDNVNLFNGNLNFHLPLLGVSGRGGAGYQMTLPIDQTWTVFRQKNEITGVVTHYPEPNWWDGIKPGYSPGVVQARHGGDGSVYCGPSRLGYKLINLGSGLRFCDSCAALVQPAGGCLALTSDLAEGITIISNSRALSVCI